MFLPRIDSETDSNNAGCGWHALYTRHQHEKSVARSLTSQNLEVFLPLVHEFHQWRDRTKKVCVPLFPSYVFVREGFVGKTRVLSTPGVFALVGWAGRPAVIPGTQVERVRRMVESSLHVEPHVYLQCGDRVRVENGPLRGIEGIIIRKNESLRLVVSIEMLGRAAAVEIDASSVRGLEAPSAVTSYAAGMCA